MEQRIGRVLEHMKAAGLTQLIVSDPKSIWYLTGVDVDPYERLFAFLLRSDGNHVFFLNRLYVVPETPYREIWFSDTDDAIGMMAETIDTSQPVGIDKEWPARFLLQLMERCPGMKPVLASHCVDDCRAVKDEKEIAAMKEASRINDLVMERAAAFIREGMTEKEIAEFIEAEFLKEGASGPSFPTIVCFGENAADAHHAPSGSVRLQKGQCVLIDMGCVVDRYCSDMTRTFFCGEPDERFMAIHELVRKATEAAEQLIRPGVRFCDLDKTARDMVEGGGFGGTFTTRLGHFIGQTDHEQGDVSALNESEAKPGMIFSIEPGVYLEGDLGVRIEDLVLVTEEGHEILNRVDRRLRCVG